MYYERETGFISVFSYISLIFCDDIKNAYVRTKCEYYSFIVQNYLLVKLLENINTLLRKFSFACITFY